VNGVRRRIRESIVRWLCKESVGEDDMVMWCKDVGLDVLLVITVR